MLICGQFIAKDLNLWSTLLFVRFEKLNVSDFWGPLNLLGPSKKSQLLDSWPLSMPLKTRPWMNLFKFFVLYHNVGPLYYWLTKRGRRKFWEPKLWGSLGKAKHWKKIEANIWDDDIEAKVWEKSLCMNLKWKIEAKTLSQEIWSNKNWGKLNW